MDILRYILLYSILLHALVGSVYTIYVTGKCNNESCNMRKVKLWHVEGGSVVSQNTGFSASIINLFIVSILLVAVFIMISLTLATWWNNRFLTCIGLCIESSLAIFFVKRAVNKCK